MELVSVSSVIIKGIYKLAKISVIVQNIEGEKHIEKCLAAIYSQDYIDFDVVVIDHSSMDDSPNIVVEKFPKASLFVIEQGMGISYGMNYGISKVDSEYVAVLDSTTYVTNGWLGSLLKGISSDNRIFSATSKLMYYDNPNIIDNAGYSVTLSGIVGKIGNGKHETKLNKPRKVFSACCDGAIYRRNVLGIAGGFDDSFFTYLVDVDASYRAFLCGYHSIYCPDAVAYTAKNIESENFIALLSSRNRIYMYYKNMPVFQRGINSAFLALGNSYQKRYYTKKGEKRFYVAGINEGKINKKRLCINKRHKRPFKRHLFIQGNLIKTSFKRLFGQ